MVKEDPELAKIIVLSWRQKYCPNVSDDDCWVSGQKPNKSGGYIQGSYDGQNKFALMHVVAFWSTGFPDREGTDVSHLCCNAACFNPMHVCLEDTKVNQTRKGCLGIIVDTNGDAFKYCKHEPMCLKRVHLNDLERI